MRRKDGAKQQAKIPQNTRSKRVQEEQKNMTPREKTKQSQDGAESQALRGKYCGAGKKKERERATKTAFLRYITGRLKINRAIYSL